MAGEGSTSARSAATGCGQSGCSGTPESGILAINGPPGTGKTTLLRDLVAASVTARAAVMSGMDDPALAFTYSGEKLKVGQRWLHLYRLTPQLKGFEILVASSNNKAVENVSAELPGSQAIAEDADLLYFSTLSDRLLERQTWGLIAAVLGNAANRSRFRRTFWWDRDVGLSTYLAEAAGTPQLIEERDPETGSQTTRRPQIVLEEDPPQSHGDALQRWKKARAAFREVIQKSHRNLKELAKTRKINESLPTLAEEEADATAAAANTLEAETRSQAAFDAARVSLVGAEKNR